MAGHLHRYPESVRSRFRQAQSIQDITRLMKEFEAAVNDGSWKAKGWPGAAYSVSKAGLIGATKVIAREDKAADRKRLINACCPGYVDTDMTKHRGVKTPAQGAQTPVMLAIGEIGEQTGEFWENEKVVEW